MCYIDRGPLGYLEVYLVGNSYIVFNMGLPVTVCHDAVELQRFVGELVNAAFDKLEREEIEKMERKGKKWLIDEFEVRRRVRKDFAPTERAHSSRKGKRGYDRRRAKSELQKELRGE